MNQFPVFPQREEFQHGTKVRILEGPFKEFIGIIKEVNTSSRRAVVAVNFFGRETSVELGFSQLTRRI